MYRYIQIMNEGKQSTFADFVNVDSVEEARDAPSTELRRKKRQEPVVSKKAEPVSPIKSYAPDGEPGGPWDEMSEEERIDFIREHGTDTMVLGLESVLQGNKYKPKREDMWVNRLYKGKRMVRTILEKKGEGGK